MHPQGCFFFSDQMWPACAKLTHILKMISFKKNLGVLGTDGAAVGPPSPPPRPLKTASQALRDPNSWNWEDRYLRGINFKLKRLVDQNLPERNRLWCARGTQGRSGAQGRRIWAWGGQGGSNSFSSLFRKIKAKHTHCRDYRAHDDVIRLQEEWQIPSRN
jgi:hypothetical protein